MKSSRIFLCAVMIVILISAPLLSVVLVHAQPPPIPRPAEIVEARIEGDGPGTIDPAACYDGANGELIARALDWPMFRQDPSRTGYSTSKAPDSNNTLWISQLSEVQDELTSPAVADGKVYVGSGSIRNENNVYCLDASDGQLIWSYKTGYAACSPTIVDGKVYVGSHDNNVYCLNATDGSLIWNYTTGAWVRSSPAIVYGKVYVGSDDGNVYCLDALDGKLIWNYTVAIGNWVISSPAVADGKVYVGSDDYSIYCLNATDGSFIWSYKTGSRVRSSPAVADRKVYVGSEDGDIYCLDTSTGALVWSFGTGGMVTSSPAVADSKVYVGSHDQNVYCLDASTGAFVWNFGTGNMVASSPAVADGKIYAGSNDNNVYCLDASDGQLIWSYTTSIDPRLAVRSSPAIAEGKVYVYTGSSVYAFGSAQSAHATASAELLMNCYDTLVFFDGEHIDRYLPQLATEWTITKNDPPIVSAHTGLNFYYTYYFKIRTGVKFHNGAILTPEDVEYTFERGMVLEPGENPQWMFYEPLLNGSTMTYINGLELDPENNVTERQWIGWAIDEAIESNSTHAWFNLAFPGAYAPFLQILTQTWSSILCKSWANGLGRASNWNGDWGADHTEYYAYHFPTVAPLDDPEPAVMGTGPFKLAHLNNTNMYWDADRFVDYWRGWGTSFPYGIGWPAFGGSKPAGYIDHYVVTWAYDWPTRKTMFLNGEVDFCAVPTQYIDQVLNQPGIRCTYRLPSLLVDVAFFTFNINPATPYGPITPAASAGDGFTPNAIPSDFFGNTEWGSMIRKAFAQALNYAQYIIEVFRGEAVHPATAIIPGLNYHDPNVTGYSYNLAAANDSFNSVPGLNTTGFTLTLPYFGSARQSACNLLKAAIESLNPLYHINVVEVTTEASYRQAAATQQLPVFIDGWLADFPDAHNFALAFYASFGASAPPYCPYASWQSYSNATMDALIEQGIATPDGTTRQDIYTQIQQLAINDCPSFTLGQAVGRHFEQSWVCGWYYNPAYPGAYAANLWKWYYTPHAQQDSIPANSTGNLLPYDVNYDGKTNMVDIGTTAASFGSIYGPPMSTKWVYRADFNNDRKIDMKDIGGVAKNFGKTATTWAPS